MPQLRGLFCFSSLVLLAFGLPAAEPADDYSACQASWDAYYSSSAGGQYYQSTTLTLSTSVLTPEHDYDVPYTTLCDSVRRQAISRSTTRTLTWDPPLTTTFLGILDKPSCPPPYIPCNTYCRLYASGLQTGTMQRFVLYDTWPMEHVVYKSCPQTFFHVIGDFFSRELTPLSCRELYGKVLT
jgi:hypothetical protein